MRLFTNCGRTAGSWETEQMTGRQKVDMASIDSQGLTSPFNNRGGIRIFCELIAQARTVLTKSDENTKDMPSERAFHRKVCPHCERLADDFEIGVCWAALQAIEEYRSIWEALWKTMVLVGIW
jgi:hypothetical protein